jgi:hypothetical protein
VEEAHVHALSTWPDEPAFQDADPRRRTSAEVDLGATWRWGGSNDAWRLAWLRGTGELYVCRADGHDGSCTDVHVLAVVEREVDLDTLLTGWSERRTDPDGLSWVAQRVDPLAVAS